jgi:hypothetical protein
MELCFPFYLEGSAPSLVEESSASPGDAEGVQTTDPSVQILACAAGQR